MNQCKRLLSSVMLSTTIFFALISTALSLPYPAYRGYGSDPYSMGGLGMGMSSPYGMMGSPYGMGGLGMGMGGGYGMSGLGGIPPPMGPPGMGGMGMGMGMGTYGSPYSGLGGLSPFWKKK